MELFSRPLIFPTGPHPSPVRTPGTGVEAGARPFLFLPKETAMDPENYPRLISYGICKHAGISTLSAMVGRVNMEEWRGFAPGTVLCQEVGWCLIDRDQYTVSAPERDYRFKMTLMVCTDGWFFPFPDDRWRNINGNFELINPYATEPKEITHDEAH